MTRPGRPAGFTLAEMLVALAIAAMLAAGVLGVVARLGRTRDLLVRHDADEAADAAARRLLELDLRHASAARALPDGLALRTHASIDPATARMQHLPAEVHYAVVRGEGSDAPAPLVRRQRVLDGPVQGQLVLVGVEAIRMEMPDGPLGGEWRDLGPQLRVTITHLDGRRTDVRVIR